MTDLTHHGDQEVRSGMVDFAVNVHAPEPPPFLREALVDAVSEIGRYPDTDAATAAVAAAHGVPPESVLLTHGAAEAFVLLARQPWRQPVVVHPQYTQPEAALLDAGHRPERLRLEPAEDFRLTRAPTSGADLVVVGNPTNPTSRLHEQDQLAGLAAIDRLLVVDEAFMDAVEDVADPVRSLARRAAQDDGTAVVRSLTKTYSLAGLRVGYVIAHPDRIAVLASGRTPWPVSSLAAAAAIVCLSDEGRQYAGQVRDELPRRLSRLSRGLTSHGFEVVPDARAPFVLARHPEAATIGDRLRHKGIAIRRGDTFPGLDDSWLRFAARDEVSVGVLMSRLADVMEPSHQ